MEEREYASREDVEDTRAIGYGVNPAVWIVLALAVVFAVAAALLQPKSTPESEAERLAEAVFGSAATSPRSRQRQTALRTCLQIGWRNSILTYWTKWKLATTCPGRTSSGPKRFR